jgi:hypothetical protein
MNLRLYDFMSLQWRVAKNEEQLQYQLGTGYQAGTVVQLSTFKILVRGSASKDCE